MSYWNKTDREFATERSLRAQLEAVTRERDEFRRQALELLTERNREQADKLAVERERDEAREELEKFRALGGGHAAFAYANVAASVERAESCVSDDEARQLRGRIEATERERDEARMVVRELRQKLAEAGVEGSPPPWETTIARLERLACEARADAARLREALLRASAACGRCGTRFGEAYGCAYCEPVTAALASTPSAEPTPRDMRVAEAVREACVTAIRDCVCPARGCSGCSQCDGCDCGGEGG